MIKQNVKMAIKSAIKQKRITVLNTLGLALGLACAIIIYLWVDDELSYEKNYKNVDQMLQVGTMFHTNLLPLR